MNQDQNSIAKKMATTLALDSPFTPQLEKTVNMCDGEFCNHS